MIRAFQKPAEIIEEAKNNSDPGNELYLRARTTTSCSNRFGFSRRGAKLGDGQSGYSING